MAEKKQNNQHQQVMQQALEKGFDVDLHNIEAEIGQCIETQNANITGVQAAHIKELRNLMEAKASIEQEIFSITKELEGIYQEHRNTLEVVVNGRIEEYDEALECLSGLETGEQKPHVESQEL